MERRAHGAAPRRRRRALRRTSRLRRRRQGLALAARHRRTVAAREPAMAAAPAASRAMSARSASRSTTPQQRREVRELAAGRARINRCKSRTRAARSRRKDRRAPSRRPKTPSVSGIPPSDTPHLEDGGLTNSGVGELEDRLAMLDVARGRQAAAARPRSSSNALAEEARERQEALRMLADDVPASSPPHVQLLLCFMQPWGASSAPRQWTLLPLLPADVRSRAAAAPSCEPQTAGAPGDCDGLRDLARLRRPSPPSGRGR